VRQGGLVEECIVVMYMESPQPAEYKINRFEYFGISISFEGREICPGYFPV